MSNGHNKEDSGPVEGSYLPEGLRRGQDTQEGRDVRPIEHDLPNVGFTNILPIFLVKPDESERGLLHHKTVVKPSEIVFCYRCRGGGQRQWWWT